MTQDAVLSPAAARLITNHIDSVGALELLLLVNRTDDRDWSLAELCAELCCPSAWVAGQLRVLDGLGLVLQPAPGRYRYVRGRQHGAAVDEIVETYRTDPSPVVKILFATPPSPGEFAR